MTNPIIEKKCKYCGADSYIGLDGKEIHGKYLKDNPIIEKAVKELKAFEMIVPDGQLKGCLVYHEAVKDFISGYIDGQNACLNEIKSKLK